MPEPTPEFEWEELLAKNAVDLLAWEAKRVLARTEEDMLDVGRGQEQFERMSGHQTAEFPAIAGKHALDPHAVPLVEREDTSLKDFHRVQRALGTAHFGEREAAICVHDHFNIQVPQSSYISETWDRADKERFLDQRMAWAECLVPDIGIRFSTVAQPGQQRGFRNTLEAVLRKTTGIQLEPSGIRRPYSSGTKRDTHSLDRHIPNDLFRHAHGS